MITGLVGFLISLGVVSLLLAGAFGIGLSVYKIVKKSVNSKRDTINKLVLEKSKSNKVQLDILDNDYKKNKKAIEKEKNNVNVDKDELKNAVLKDRADVVNKKKWEKPTVEFVESKDTLDKNDKNFNSVQLLEEDDLDENNSDFTTRANKILQDTLDEEKEKIQ